MVSTNKNPKNRKNELKQLSQSLNEDIINGNPHKSKLLLNKSLAVNGNNSLNGEDVNMKDTAKAVKNTPKAVKNTPVALKNTPKAVKNTPVALKNTTKAVKNTPVALKNTTKALQNTPKAVKNSPRALKKTSIAMENTPVALKNTPKAVKNTPETEKDKSFIEKVPKEILQTENSTSTFDNELVQSKNQKRKRSLDENSEEMDSTIKSPIKRKKMSISTPCFKDTTPKGSLNSTTNGISPIKMTSIKKNKKRNSLETSKRKRDDSLDAIEWSDGLENPKTKEIEGSFRKERRISGNKETLGGVNSGEQSDLHSGKSIKKKKVKSNKSHLAEKEELSSQNLDLTQKNKKQKKELDHESESKENEDLSQDTVNKSSKKSKKKKNKNSKSQLQIESDPKDLCSQDFETESFLKKNKNKELKSHSDTKDSISQEVESSPKKIKKKNKELKSQSNTQDNEVKPSPKKNKKKKNKGSKSNTKETETDSTSPKEKNTDNVSSPQKNKNKSSIKKNKKDIEVSDEPEIERTLYVGNIPVGTKRKTLRSIFTKFGKIVTVRIRGLVPPNPYMSKRNAFKSGKQHPKRTSCHAYVVYVGANCVKNAVESDTIMIKENTLRLDFATPSKSAIEAAIGDTVFVGNLPFEIEQEQLRNHFNSCGDICNIRVVRDKELGSGKGFAFVQFKDKDSVEFALKQNETIIEGRSIRVSRYQKNFKNNKHGNKGQARFGAARKTIGVSTRDFKRAKQQETKTRNKLSLKCLQKQENPEPKFQKKHFIGSQVEDRNTGLKKKIKANKGDKKKLDVAHKLTGNKSVAKKNVKLQI